MTLSNPIFDYEYLYALIVIIILLIRILKDKISLKYSIHRLQVKELDLILCIGYIILGVNIIRNSTPLSIASIYPLIVYPLIYILIKFSASQTKTVKTITLIITFISVTELIIGSLQVTSAVASVNSLFKVTGSFGSPAVYINYLICIIPFSFYTIYNGKDYSPLAKGGFFLLTIWILIILLFFTSSRLAWMTLFFQIFLILLLKKKLDIKVSKNNIYKFLGIFSLTAVLFFSMLVIKPQSTSGRWFVLKNSLVILKQNYASGIGISRFDVVYNDFQENYFKSNNDKQGEYLASYISVAYNDYLQLFIETGIFGFFMICMLIFKLLKIGLNIRNKYRHIDHEVQPAIICCFTILFLALFSFPFRLSPVLTIFIIALSICSNYDNKTYFSLRTKGFVSFSLLSIIVLTLLVRLFVSYDKQIKWRNVENYKTVKNVNNIQIIKIYDELKPELQTNIDFIESYARTCYGLKNYKKAIVSLQIANKYSSKYDVYLLLGMCYEEINEIELAEKAYLKCSFLVPNLFIARYRLMMLYHNRKNHSEAIKWANVIINMPIKVNSPAIEKIKKIAMSMVKLNSSL